METCPELSTGFHGYPQVSAPAMWTTGVISSLIKGLIYYNIYKNAESLLSVSGREVLEGEIEDYERY